jgi:DNA-damage-inducible protein J
MIHVRIDDDLKARATHKLAAFGLTVSDAVRILLTRIDQDGTLPMELVTPPETYDAWFRAKVQAALTDARPSVSHSKVMDEVQTLIDQKRLARKA